MTASFDFANCSEEQLWRYVAAHLERCEIGVELAAPGANTVGILAESWVENRPTTRPGYPGGNVSSPGSGQAQRPELSRPSWREQQQGAHRGEV